MTIKFFITSWSGCSLCGSYTFYVGAILFTKTHNLIHVICDNRGFMIHQSDTSEEGQVTRNVTLLIPPTHPQQLHLDWTTGSQRHILTVAIEAMILRSCITFESKQEGCKVTPLHYVALSTAKQSGSSQSTS